MFKQVNPTSPTHRGTAFFQRTQCAQVVSWASYGSHLRTWHRRWSNQHHMTKAAQNRQEKQAKTAKCIARITHMCGGADA